MKIQDLNSELELKDESELKTESKEIRTPEEPISEKKEIPEARDANSRTVCLKKGTYETRYYDRPIHYRANGNAYEAIQNMLTDAEDGCISENCTHPFHARFYRQKDNPILFSLEKGVHILTVSVQGKFGSPAERPVPDADRAAGNLFYPNVLPGTDYCAALTQNGVKLGITVKESGAPARFAFRLTGETLSAVWNEQKKTLCFFADPSEEPVFEIPAPFLTDGAGAYAECVSYEVVQNGEETVLTVIPDHGWMTAKDRVYPVRMSWSVCCVAHGCRGFCFEDAALSADGKVAIGGNETHFRMQLPQKKEGVITRKVSALFRCDTVPLNEEKTYLLALKRIPADAEPQLIGCSAMRLGQEEYAFDVSPEYEIEDATYALQLCEEKDGELIGVTDSAVAVLQMSGNDAVATFAVAETDGNADADKESAGESGSIGSVGTYEVDLGTGKLNMEVKDFAWEGNRMPVTISRSYRGQYANRHYHSWGGNKTSCFSSMEIGQGWRLNLWQSVVLSGSNYIYTDESGEEITLKPCKCESGTATCNLYEDESGLGYVFDPRNGELKKGDETYTFQSGRLVKIKNRFNVTLNIVYANGRISSVSDGVGRTFQFFYSGNELTSIIAPNGSTVAYGYCGGKLCCETHPNGQKIAYEYDTFGLPNAITVSGSGIAEMTTRFTIANGKVNKITTESDNTVSGKSVAISSHEKQSIVTESDSDKGKDGTPHTITKVRVHFPETPEKDYSYYAADETENKVTIIKSERLPYTEPGMEIGNLRCENLLQNHNFKRNGIDIDLTGWSNNLVGQQYRDIFFDPPEGMPGGIAAYLVSLYDTDRARGMWQTVSLDANTQYVFSCYLKLDQWSSKPTYGVYLMVKKSDGTVVARSVYVNRREPFVRVALPFRTCGSCTNYTVGIYIDGNVKAKAIAPQLEKGNKLSPYNYLAANESTKTVYGSASCNNSQLLATVSVPSGKDVRETFTFSGYVAGGNLLHAELRARICYWQTSEERRNGTIPQDEFSVPVYQNGQFAMLQFSKQQYRSVEKVELYCCNLGNQGAATFSNLQLVRNSFVSGLAETDFQVTQTDEAETEGEISANAKADETAEEVETISFEEALDAFGNALTGTNFKNGEFGAIYTEQKFEDSNLNDAFSDVGNNKTVEIDARGKTTKYEYNPVTSKPTKVTDRCENATSYTYDMAGRTTEITAPNGGTVSYGYNAYDDLTGITRGDGQTYGMTYDPYRNLTGVSVGGNPLVTYGYRSGSGRLKSMTYANGARQELTYDSFGNVKGEKWTKGNTIEAHYRYFYNASNQLTKTLDILNKKVYNINRVGENVVSVEEYDAASVSATTFAATDLTHVGTMHYSFDSDGKQFRKKYVAADGTEQKYVFEFRDEQNVAVQLPTGAVSHAKTDHLGRKVFDEIQLRTGLMNRTFTYHEGAVTKAHETAGKQVSEPTTTLVKEIRFHDGRTIAYEYDAEERITKVTDSADGVTEYTYDALGQLLTETVDGTVVNTMTYDKYGNILTKNSIAYTYGNAKWKDLLTAYNGQAISYDAQGNPTHYLGHTLTWEKGRQLKTFGANSYKYNNDGIRIQKRTATEIHDYILDGTNILKELVTDTGGCPKYTNEYLYDLDGTVCGIKHNGTAYYFYKNLQGDVIAITNANGAVVARYTYDAWGVPTIKEDTSGCNIATVNPFRYRGYYYDTETKLYYLQSRY